MEKEKEKGAQDVQVQPMEKEEDLAHTTMASAMEKAKQECE